MHQFVRIGAHAFIGAQSMVDTDVIPYGMAVGNRAHLAGLNLVGLRRRAFDREAVHALRTAYRMIFSSEGTLRERVDDAATMFKSRAAGPGRRRLHHRLHRPAALPAAQRPERRLDAAQPAVRGRARSSLQRSPPRANAGHKVQVLSLTPRDDLPGVKVIEADVANPLGILWSLKVFRTTHIVMAGAISLSDKTREALAKFAAGDGKDSATTRRIGGRCDALAPRGEPRADDRRAR